MRPHVCDLCLARKCCRFPAGFQTQAFSGCKERIDTVVHADLEETNPAHSQPPSWLPSFPTSLIICLIHEILRMEVSIVLIWLNLGEVCGGLNMNLRTGHPACMVTWLTKQNRSPLRKTPAWLCRTHCGCAANPSLHLQTVSQSTSLHEARQHWRLWATNPLACC